MINPSNWEYAHIGIEGDSARIKGHKVWGQNWRRIEGEVRLPDPSHPNQIHDFRIYEIGSIEKPVRFAAAELSMNVWGFYVPL